MPFGTFVSVIYHLDAECYTAIVYGGVPKGQRDKSDDFVTALLQLMKDDPASRIVLNACLTASNSVDKPGRNPRRHYACLSVPQLCQLPIKELLAKDAVLFLWVPGPFLAIGAHLPVMKA